MTVRPAPERPQEIAISPAPERPQEIAISPAPQQNVSRDPLGRLIQDILAARSEEDLRPSKADFVKTIRSQIAAPIGPRSRVFPGLERIGQ